MDQTKEKTSRGHSSRTTALTESCHQRRATFLQALTRCRGPQPGAYKPRTTRLDNMDKNTKASTISKHNTNKPELQSGTTAPAPRVKQTTSPPVLPYSSPHPLSFTLIHSPPPLHSLLNPPCPTHPAPYHSKKKYHAS